MKPLLKTYILTSILILSISSSLFSQGKKIEHINSDYGRVKEGVYNGNLVLSGNVKFRHQGSTLTADTVIWDRDNNSIFAKSNVHMSFGDTVTLRAKELDYNGSSKIAIARKNVVLKDRTQTLETEELIYDRNTNLAYFKTRSKIIQQGNIMYSNFGSYNLSTRSTYFENNVNINTKDHNIDGDNITFYNEQGKAVFKGPTTITDRKNPKNYIYTEDGVYYTKRKEAFLKKNSRIHFDGKVLTGDNMYFNQNTGFGKGKGNVTLDDPQEKRFIKGGYGEVYQNQDSAIITEKPYVVKAFKKDSLYISADTLIAKRNKQQQSTINGYHKVRMYKQDGQAKCDSLVYKETIGQMHFYKDPVFWNGPRQLTGDTIVSYIAVREQRLDSIKILSNAFAISKTDSLTLTDFNQVKGRKILGKITDEELNYINVEGNAESLIYADDEDKEKGIINRIGINKAICGIIEADFVAKAVHIISCQYNAEAKLYPMDKILQKDRYLKGFTWRAKERLQKWTDIFLDIPNNNIENITLESDEEDTKETKKRIPTQPIRNKKKDLNKNIKIQPNENN